jgi:hypothetical protein
MAEDTLSDATLQTLERMRAEGFRIHGPGPVTQGGTTPTPDAKDPLPGMHVQMVHGSRIVDGFGVTAEQAVQDALIKLEGYDPQGKVHLGA